MLSVYIVSAVVGGALVFLSAFLGGDGDLDTDFDTDLDADFDADLDVDVDADVDIDADADVDLDGHGDLVHATWLPFLGLRFWTYTSAFFGLSGTLLTALSDLGTLATFAVALGTGLVSGFGISTLSRLLKLSQTDSATRVSDLVGAEGTVLLNVSKLSPGKIRCQVKGELLDLLARADGDEVIEAGCKVLVVGFEDSEATVVRRSSLIGG